MLKKNEVHVKKWLFTNFFSIAAVVVAVANLWLMSQLAPLTQHVDKLEGKVLANEHSINLVREELIYIRNRVDKIYNLMIKQ